MTRAPGGARPRHPDPRPLGDLAARLLLPLPPEARDVAVTGVTARAQDARPGDLFVGLPGAADHGATFATRAQEGGAVALLTDARGAGLARGSGLPVLVVADPRRVLGTAAGWLHRTGERLPLLLGVTGTNGKTTTVHLLEHLLGLLGTPAAVSSTAESGPAGERGPSRLTTPEADELHAMLARAVELGSRAAILEVSAQALVRSRVEGLVFDVAGFTNLTHDHLDDFGDMPRYLDAKARLFRRGTSRRAVVCLDSPAAPGLVERLEIPVATVSAVPGTADWTVSDVAVGADTTAFRLDGPAGGLSTAVGLVGAHQAMDAALAIVMTLEAGFAFVRVEEALRPAGLRPRLSGRLERVPGSVDPAVYIDVGHTPDAIAKSLEALRPITSGRLVVLFGADGDRDATKRGPMGRTAARLADLVIVHDHHARFEDPDRIRAMVLAGTAGGRAAVLEVRDPADAIRRAIEAAGADGTVLWAGTGRTVYRDIRGTKHPYSFWDQAVSAVAEHAAR